MPSGPPSTLGSGLHDDAVASNGVDRPIAAVYGKSARRRHDANNDHGALLVVTAWAGEYVLRIDQKVCAARSNEITAISDYFRKIDVQGEIVAIDAMGTRRRKVIGEICSLQSAAAD